MLEYAKIRLGEKTARSSCTEHQQLQQLQYRSGRYDSYRMAAAIILYHACSMQYKRTVALQQRNHNNTTKHNTQHTRNVRKRIIQNAKCVTKRQKNESF